jgi:hypothetical protein
VWKFKTTRKSPSVHMCNKSPLIAKPKKLYNFYCYLEKKGTFLGGIPSFRKEKQTITTVHYNL